MGKILRDFFWVSYDNLGKLIGASAIWFLLSFGAIIVAAPVAQYAGPAGLVPSLIVASGIAVSLAIAPSATAGVAHFTALLVDRKDARIADIFQGMRTYYVKATILGLVAILGWTVLTVNIIFYARVMGTRNFWLAAVLGGITIWMFVFYNVMLVYSLPLLVRKKARIAGTFKLAALLTLDNVRISFGLYLSVLVVVFLSVFTGVGAIFLMAGLCGVLVNMGYKELVKRYARIERAKAGLEPLEEEEEHAGRGLRDILKPWEM